MPLKCGDATGKDLIEAANTAESKAAIADVALFKLRERATKLENRALDLENGLGGGTGGISKRLTDAEQDVRDLQTADDKFALKTQVTTDIQSLADTVDAAKIKSDATDLKGKTDSMKTSVDTLVTESTALHHEDTGWVAKDDSLKEDVDNLSTLVGPLVTDQTALNHITDGWVAKDTSLEEAAGLLTTRVSDAETVIGTMLTDQTALNHATTGWVAKDEELKSTTNFTGAACDLVRKLEDNRDHCVVVVYGDRSTTDDWPRELAGWYATEYPDYSVDYQHWDSTWTTEEVNLGNNSLGAGYPKKLKVYNIQSGSDIKHILAGGSGGRENTVLGVDRADLVISCFRGSTFETNYRELTVPTYMSFIMPLLERHQGAGVILVAEHPSQEAASSGAENSRNAMYELATLLEVDVADVYKKFMVLDRAEDLYINLVTASSKGKSLYTETIKELHKRGISRVAEPSMLLTGDNLLENGDFADFNTAIPKGWSGEVTCARETSMYDSRKKYSVHVTGTGTLQYSIPVDESEELHGKWVTLAVRCRLGSGGSGIVSITNNFGSAETQPLGLEAIEWRWIVLSRYIRTGTSHIHVELGAGGIYDRAILVKGRIPRDIETRPEVLPPAPVVTPAPANYKGATGKLMRKLDAGIENCTITVYDASTSVSAGSGWISAYTESFREAYPDHNIRHNQWIKNDTDDRWNGNITFQSGTPGYPTLTVNALSGGTIPSHILGSRWKEAALTKDTSDLIIISYGKGVEISLPAHNENFEYELTPALQELVLPLLMSHVGAGVIVVIPAPDLTGEATRTMWKASHDLAELHGYDVADVHNEIMRLGQNSTYLTATGVTNAGRQVYVDMLTRLHKTGMHNAAISSLEGAGRNLLHNSDFEQWSVMLVNNWSSSNVTLFRDNLITEGINVSSGVAMFSLSVTVTNTSIDGNIHQDLDEDTVKSLQGQWITLAARVYTLAGGTEANGANGALRITSGTTEVNSVSTGTGGAGWRWRFLTIKVGKDDTTIEVMLRGTANYDRVILVKGRLPRDAGQYFRGL